MTDTKTIAEQFLAALAADEAAPFEALLADGCGLRVYGWQGGEVYSPRARVMDRLRGEWAAWAEPKMETLSVLADGERAAVEFRILTRLDGRFVEHYRSAFLTTAEGRVTVIELYCGEPMPSGRRQGYIAPATLTEAEVLALFEEQRTTGDPREWVSPGFRGRRSLRFFIGGSDGAHPGMNSVGGARWSAEEADARIEEIIAWHRERNFGFQWFTGPFDTPADLCARLERHGLVRAGSSAMMARIGLDDLSDIPLNPDVTVEVLDGSDEQAIEDDLQIVAEGFHWPPEQIEEMRPHFVQRLKNPKFREHEITYLARVNGRPVAHARLIVRSMMAYLGGAATRPDARGRHIYSTLLRRRLEDAHARGYHIAAIDAGPMSRRVVEKYGFRKLSDEHLYAWMPVMDMDVIRSLVPND